MHVSTEMAKTTERSAAPFVPKSTSVRVLREAFVGPAGALLDKALADAGIPRAKVYVTNAVKHFKWEPRGKRRIHKKPRVSEIKACRPWLEAELRAVKPVVVVCLGATAAQSVLGAQFKLMQQRGQVFPSPLAERVVATIHPSAVLRAPDSEGRRMAYDSLVADLKVAARVAKGVAGRPGPPPKPRSGEGGDPA